MKRFVLSLLMLAVVAMVCGQAMARTSEEPAGEGRITIDELKAKLAKGEKVIIIDVRGADYESSDMRIKGAIRIAPAELEAHLKELPRNKEIVTYCACSTDGGAMKARQTLLDNGFKNVHALKGGWNSWVQSGGPTEPKVQANNK